MTDCIIIFVFLALFLCSVFRTMEKLIRFERELHLLEIVGMLTIP